MADDEAVYSVNLEDNTSGAAESAASALAKLQKQMDADTKALRAMQSAMKNLQQGTVVNVEQFRKLDAQIKAKKASIAQAQSAYLSLGGGFGKTKSSASSLQSRFDALSKTAQGMPGPLSGLVSQLGNIRGLVAGGVIVAGIVAIVAALVALAAAAAVAVVALAKYGVAQANARRAELLRLEGLTKMRSWWGIPAGNAREMQDAIDRVSGSTTLGRAKLEQYSSELYRMGLRGANLGHALEAASIKGAALGDEGAKSAMHWAAGIAMTGGSVKKLSDDIKARFGGVVAKQMLDLNVQMEKLQENFASLFARLQIEGLLKAIASITSMFATTSASGRALRVIFETMLTPLIGAATSAAPVLKRFMQGIIIGTLLVTLAIIRLRVWWKKTFGDSELLTSMDLQRAALLAGVAAVAALISVFVILGGFVGIVVGVFATLAWSVLRFIKGIGMVWNFMKSIPWIELGTGIAKGIARGVKNGATWVIDAVKNLGAAAWKAFKSKLGIESPSKAFAELGLQIPAGVEKGIEQGAPRAQAAADGMVEPRAGRGGAGSSGPRIEIGTIVVQTQATDAKGIAADIGQELRRALEGAAIQLGVPV